MDGSMISAQNDQLFFLNSAFGIGFVPREQKAHDQFGLKKIICRKGFKDVFLSCLAGLSGSRWA
jgi:hypothetical protein